MAFLIGGANTTSDAGYDVANSCRFNDDDTAYMHKTPGGAGNMKTWTWNAWIKRGTMGASQFLMQGYAGSADETQVYISSGGAFAFYTIGTGMGDNKTISSTDLLRDPSAWYMITVRVDTTDSTANNRCRLYVNGVEVTYTNHDALTEDGDGAVNEDVIQYLGRRYDGDYFDGYMAEVCLVDGSSLAPTSFGEFNSDSPTIWQPIDVSGLSFGTNGYYLDFEASANLGNDANGGTDLTEVNLAATDQAADSPTNNWCVMNPLDNFYAGSTFSEGNLKIVTASGTRTWVRSTFGVNTGKWYWEQRLTVESTDSAEDDVVGIVDRATTTALLSLDSSSSCPGLVLRENGKIFTYLSGSSGETAGWNTFGDDDIVMVALDLDNNKIYFGTNGTWGNSSDPAGDSNGFAITHASSGGHDGVFYCAVSILNNNSSNTWEVNFGCPTFAISSSNADDDGYGNFEYDVPAGFFSLCSKNLAEYG